MKIRKVGRPKIIIQQEAEEDGLSGWGDLLLHLVVGLILLATWLYSQ